jgi:hypothetical protein
MLKTDKRAGKKIKFKKMKNKIYTLVIILLYSTATFGQAPNWQWAHSAGGVYNEYSFSCATDAAGNVFVTGLFESSSITFGTIVLNNASIGYQDMFIVKYDAAGNVLWAHSAGGIYTDEGLSIATDGYGNVLVTGDFISPSISFGTNVLTNTNGNADIFVVKYDGAGNVLWALSEGGTDFDYGYGIATDAGGNVLVTGRFDSPSITFGATVLTNAGARDMFIVKYDAGGNVLWANSAGGTDVDYSNGVATDGSGNVLVTGNFGSDSITFGTTVLTINANIGYYDIFIVKYDSAGNVLWANSAGGTDWDNGSSVATDTGGNVLVTGNFYAPSIAFETTVLTSAGTRDMFIVKYDPSGNLLWANSAGGTEWDNGNSVATDAGGNVLVTGSFGGDSITFGTTVLIGTGSGNLFVVKYSPASNVLWANSADGAGNATDVAMDDLGNILVTGYSGSPIITFGTTMLTNGGSNDMFVAKLDNITGIAQENYSVEAVNISPNPSADGQFIVSNANNMNEIKITNSLGQIIYKKESYEKKCSIQLNETGIYFIQIISGNQSVAKKIIVSSAMRGAVFR